jgi:hypothetical protein
MLWYFVNNWSGDLNPNLINLESYSIQSLMYKSSRDLIANDKEFDYYEVDSYDGCWQTMMDIVHDELTFRKQAFPIIHGVVETEIFSDYPRQDAKIFYFLTAKGEKFIDCWEKGLMFDFQTELPNVEVTREYLTKLLESTSWGEATVKAFKRIDHPELKTLKDQFVFKMLRSQPSGSWFMED